LSDYTKFPGWPENRTQGVEFILDKQTDKEYIKMMEAEQNRVNAAIDEHMNKAIKAFDDEVEQVIIQHGYGVQLEKALHGKTKTMRTRNLNILRKLIDIVDAPVQIEQIDECTYQGLGGYQIIWKGKTK
jgi:hypothetical protein